jgi:hypothetical protein
MLLYDAAVGLVRALGAGVDGEGLQWSDFGLLLELDRLETANSELTPGISRAFFRNEIELSEAVLDRAVKRLSGPDGWLERFLSPKSGSAPHARRDHCQQVSHAEATISRMQVRIRFSTDGSIRWKLLKANLQDAAARWFRGLAQQELSKHQFVTWAWRSRLKELQAARRT